MISPKHVAIIMDGNGRWAKARGLPRTFGHRKGVETVREVVKSAREFGIEYLTLYAFSSENWRRPADEVSDLMGLLKLFIKRDLAELHSANVRIRVIGERDGLRSDILQLLLEAETATSGNTGLVLVIAFNYGARDEIARAFRRMSREIAEGRLTEMDIRPDTISAFLDTSGMPDPDLIIRTSGEVRLSNFLMWQAAYSELVFVPELWPDFDRKVFLSALDEFAGRERRFGAVEAQGKAAGSK